jgi:signal transduction histidine kinase
VTVNISYDEDSSVLKTEVKDTGIGIKPEDMVKLFRFFGTISKSKDINRGDGSWPDYIKANSE